MLTYLHVFGLGIGLLIMSKIADVGIPETPTPLASANVGNGDTPPPPPLKPADVLNGWSLTKVLHMYVQNITKIQKPSYYGCENWNLGRSCLFTAVPK